MFWPLWADWPNKLWVFGGFLVIMTICFRGCNVREAFFSGRTIFREDKVSGSTSSMRRLFWNPIFKRLWYFLFLSIWSLQNCQRQCRWRPLFLQKLFWNYGKDWFRWSTCPLVCFNWLLNHMIYLKLSWENSHKNVLIKKNYHPFVLLIL